MSTNLKLLIQVVRWYPQGISHGETHKGSVYIILKYDAHVDKILQMQKDIYIVCWASIYTNMRTKTPYNNCVNNEGHIFGEGGS
jgi:hypothetical protein